MRVSPEVVDHGRGGVFRILDVKLGVVFQPSQHFIRKLFGFDVQLVRKLIPDELISQGYKVSHSVLNDDEEANIR